MSESLSRFWGTSNVDFCFCRFWPDLLDTQKWQERLELLRGEDMQTVYGCNGECKELQTKITEMGGMSRLKHYEGGQERLAQREREKEALQGLLATHCREFHDHVRQYPILERLKELRQFVWDRDLDLEIDPQILHEKHYLGEKEYGEINRACRMMVNQHELRKRARLIQVQDDEEEIPDFGLMASAGRACNDTRPWDIRVEQALEDGMEAQRTMFWDDELHVEMKDPSDSQTLLESYSQYGIEFDWHEVARPGSEWDKTLKKAWKSHKQVGMLWIDSTDRRWGLDVLLGFERFRPRNGRREQLHVVTHELRPRNDNTGWDINVQFTPKQCNRQDPCSTRGVMDRYWDSKCKVCKRTLAWCGQLVFEPFLFDYVSKDKHGWFVTIATELKRELRGMFSRGTCLWVFGLISTPENEESKEEEMKE